jgi:DNA-binding transcriptional ArsR family regulator
MRGRATAQRRPNLAEAELDLDTLVANARGASEFLKALSHEARLMILCLLVDGEKSVSDIEETLKLRQPAVSQQLARLRADDLVEARREGKNIYYSLAGSEVRDIIEALHRAFCKPRRAK